MKTTTQQTADRAASVVIPVIVAIYLVSILMIVIF